MIRLSWKKLDMRAPRFIKFISPVIAIINIGERYFKRIHIRILKKFYDPYIWLLPWMHDMLLRREKG